MADETKRAWYSLPRGALFDLLHHALLATTIAALTLALDTTRTFADLDMETRAFVTRLRAEKQDTFREQVGKKGFQSRFDVDAAGDRPLVLDIVLPIEAARHRDQTVHQFYAEFIRALADKQPRLVAIDALLDPGIDAPILHDPRIDREKLRSQVILPGIGDILRDPNSVFLPPATRDRVADAQRTLQELDRALADRRLLDEALKYASERTRLVLTAPPLPQNALALVQFNVDGSDPDKIAFERQIAWMRRMCALPNVVMAIRVPPPRPILSQYDRRSLTLGNVATIALKSNAKSAGAHPPAKDGGPPDSPKGVSVCSIVKEVKDEPGRRSIDRHERLIEQLSRLYPTDSRLDQATFNPDFFETLSYFAPLNFQLAPPERDTASLLPPRLTQKVVFVGEGFPRVRVLLDYPIPAAEMHAAVLYSNQHAIGTLSHAAVFVVDVAIGTLLGFIFMWSWGVYVRASDRMIEIPIADWQPKLRSWIWARLVLLPANLLLLAGLIAATWWLSNELLRLGSWINPLPLVIGMSLKGLLSSRQRHVGHFPGSFKELITKHPDMVWQPVVIIVALCVYVFAH